MLSFFFFFQNKKRCVFFCLFNTFNFCAPPMLFFFELGCTETMCSSFYVPSVSAISSVIPLYLNFLDITTNLFALFITFLLYYFLIFFSILSSSQLLLYNVYLFFFSLVFPLIQLKICIPHTIKHFA